MLNGVYPKFIEIFEYWDKKIINTYFYYDFQVLWCKQGIRQIRAQKDCKKRRTLYEDNGASNDARIHGVSQKALVCPLLPGWFSREV